MEATTGRGCSYLRAPSRKTPPRTQHISIVVVDDHRFMRELISTMLARQEGRYQVVAGKNGATGAAFVDAHALP